MQPGVQNIPVQSTPIRSTPGRSTPGQTLTFGSLFAGVGGLDLGLERAGMRCAWQVEIDPWCRGVLARHWPGAKRFEDVRGVGPGELSKVDVIAGGFPCQDVSQAGKKLGVKEGRRSGLWSEFYRIVCELQPRYVLVENVAALRFKGRGLDIVLGDLAKSGYDAVWDCVAAAHVGAPHLRERIFVIAYAGRFDVPVPELSPPFGRDLGRYWQPDGAADWNGVSINRKDGRGVVAAATEHLRCAPLIDRVADGVPDWAHRLKAAGNAVVPQVAEHFATMIVQHDQSVNSRLQSTPARPGLWVQ